MDIAVNPEDDTYQERLLVALLGLNLKTKQNKTNPHPAAISKQGTHMQTALQEQAFTELPAHTVFLLSELSLIKEFLEFYFNQNRTEALPVQ